MRTSLEASRDPDGGLRGNVIVAGRAMIAAPLIVSPMAGSGLGMGCSDDAEQHEVALLFGRTPDMGRAVMHVPRVAPDRRDGVVDWLPVSGREPDFERGHIGLAARPV